MDTPNIAPNNNMSSETDRMAKIVMDNNMDTDSEEIMSINSDETMEVEPNNVPKSAPKTTTTVSQSWSSWLAEFIWPPSREGWDWDCDPDPSNDYFRIVTKANTTPAPDVPDYLQRHGSLGKDQICAICFWAPDHIFQLMKPADCRPEDWKELEIRWHSLAADKPFEPLSQTARNLLRRLQRRLKEFVGQIRDLWVLIREVLREPRMDLGVEDLEIVKQILNLEIAIKRFIGKDISKPESTENKPGQGKIRLTLQESISDLGNIGILLRRIVENARQSDLGRLDIVVKMGKLENDIWTFILANSQEKANT